MSSRIDRVGNTADRYASSEPTESGAVRVEGSTLSRRAFIGAAVAGTAALGSPVLFGCQKQSQAATLVPENWDQEADIVVCGFGAAGGAAAVEADKAGVTCLVLEKQDSSTAGGDMRASAGGLFWLATLADQLKKTTFGAMGEAWYEAVHGEAVKLTQLFEEGGVKWALKADPESSDYTLPVGGGPGVYEALVERVKQTRAKVLYETAATELIVDRTKGEVVGVYAEQAGKRIAVKAKKGVILATGGYAANADLVGSISLPGVKTYPLGSPYCTGDGLAMGASVGAKITRMWKPLEFDYPVSKAASEANNGLGIFIPRPEAWTHPSEIQVNSRGERFMNEYAYMTHWKDDTPAALSFHYYSLSGAPNSVKDAFVNQPAFLIVDQACFAADSLGNTLAMYSWAKQHESGYVWSKDNKAELDKGWIIKADTIQELGSKIGISGEALAATVNRYNGFCAKGSDDDFFRQADKLIALGEGPYYAVELGFPIIYTIGGLTPDDNSRTLDWKGKPISRLYHAGNIGQPCFTMPFGFTGSMACAAIAAKHAAGLTVWDAEG